VREAGGSYPGRNIIVRGAFSPTRQLVRFFSPEHGTYSKATIFKTTVITKITEINLRWLCPIRDSQWSLLETSTRQDKTRLVISAPSFRTGSLCVVGEVGISQPLQHRGCAE